MSKNNSEQKEKPLAEISLKMACGSKMALKYIKNRESARDSLCLITINSLAHVQRRIVIVFYVEEEKLCIDKNKGNSLVVPLFEILY